MLAVLCASYLRLPLHWHTYQKGKSVGHGAVRNENSLYLLQGEKSVLKS